MQTGIRRDPTTYKPLAMKLDAERGEVLMRLSEKISWLSMEPGEAKSLAAELHNKAIEAERQRKEMRRGKAA